MEYESITIKTNRNLPEGRKEVIIYFLDSQGRIRVTRREMEKDNETLSIYMKVKKEEFEINKEYGKRLMNLLEEIKKKLNDSIKFT